MSAHLDEIAAALSAASILLMVFGFLVHLHRRQLRARLQLVVGGGPVGVDSVGRTSASRRQRSFLPGLRFGARQAQLTRAGISMSPRRFTLIHVASGLVATGLARLVAGAMGLTGPSLVLALMAGLFIGLAVPPLVLRFKRTRRLKQFEGQFGDALDAMANAMEVGMSLSQALENISRDMPAPLGIEFGHVLRELGLGLPIGEALDGLADRVPLQDVQIFAAAVQIQYRTGGPLSYVLRTIAAAVRERANLRGEIRSMTAQQRYSAYIIAAVPILLAAVMKFMSPAYFDRLLEPGTMRLLLIAGMAGIVAGFYFMMRIADIEV